MSFQWEECVSQPPPEQAWFPRLSLSLPRALQGVGTVQDNPSPLLGSQLGSQPALSQARGSCCTHSEGQGVLRKTGRSLQLGRSDETVGTTQKMHRDMNTYLQTFACKFKALIYLIYTKFFPPYFSIWGWKPEVNCLCDSMRTGGGAVEEEVWHFAQATPEQGKGWETVTRGA